MLVQMAKNQNPKVTCVCLTADRQKYTDRAVQCFQSQTYPRKELLIYDSGVESYLLSLHLAKNVFVVRQEPEPGITIGELRNRANALIIDSDDRLIAHWDSDDWHAPECLDIQIAMMDQRKIGGFYNMVFRDRTTAPAQAWSYASDTSYCVGASLLYSIQTWKNDHFPHRNVGEDTAWQLGKRTLPASVFGTFQPLMVCDIHGGNTASRIVRDAEDNQWIRRHDLDEFVAGLGSPL